jgi:hemin uptake protein HemP
MSTIRRDETVPAAKAGERRLTLHRDVSGSWATTSEALLASEGRLTIHHGGESYQLRLTRQNRLILTK